MLSLPSSRATSHHEGRDHPIPARLELGQHFADPAVSKDGADRRPGYTTQAGVDDCSERHRFVAAVLAGREVEPVSLPRRILLIVLNPRGRAAVSFQGGKG